MVVLLRTNLTVYFSSPKVVARLMTKSPVAVLDQVYMFVRSGSSKGLVPDSPGIKAVRFLISLLFRSSSMRQPLTLSRRTPKSCSFLMT